MIIDNYGKKPLLIFDLSWHNRRGSKEIFLRKAKTTGIVLVLGRCKKVDLTLFY
jgi:hypothetical protein